jgi:hypothetical protein
MGNIPLVVAFLCAVLILAVIKCRMVDRQRNDASIHWPMVPAKFETGDVSVGENSRLHFLFSYIVDGREYTGHFVETSLRGNYYDLMRSFKQGPLYVRYNPSDRVIMC